MARDDDQKPRVIITKAGRGYLVEMRLLGQSVHVEGAEDKREAMTKARNMKNAFFQSPLGFHTVKIVDKSRYGGTKTTTYKRKRGKKTTTYKKRKTRKKTRKSIGKRKR